MEEITYDWLRKQQSKEKAEPYLTELSEDFYDKVSDFVQKWKKKLSAGFEVGEAREYENALKILKDIYYRREQKIVFKALKAARSGESVSGLIKEEKNLFDSILALLREEEQRFSSLLSAPKERKPKERKELRALANIPAFVGLDGKNYGPFMTGAIFALPAKESETLLNKKVAEEV